MKIAICAALYEAGRPFLADFVRSLRVASVGHDAIFVAAIDGLENPGEALADLERDLDIVTVHVDPGHTPAGVRRVMLTSGQASGADVLAFIDMDDVIAPKGLERHLAALEDADFSYGDLELVDASGCSLGRRFFDNVWIPDQVDDVVAIRDRNFLGFSNTAVRAGRISPVALIVPEDIVAADWWFFTMLMLGGLRGRKTAGPVAAYRLHDANLLGVRAPGTVSAAIIQSEAMLRHYRAFSSHPLLAGRAENTEKVLMKLRDLPAQELSECLCGASFESGVWFEGVGRIAENLSFVPPVKTI